MKEDEEDELTKITSKKSKVSTDTEIEEYIMQYKACEKEIFKNMKISPDFKKPHPQIKKKKNKKESISDMEIDGEDREVSESSSDSDSETEAFRKPNKFENFLNFDRILPFSVNKKYSFDENVINSFFEAVDGVYSEKTQFSSFFPFAMSSSKQDSSTIASNSKNTTSFAQYIKNDSVNNPMERLLYAIASLLREISSTTKTCKKFFVKNPKNYRTIFNILKFLNGKWSSMEQKAKILKEMKKTVDRISSNENQIQEQGHILRSLRDKGLQEDLFENPTLFMYGEGDEDFNSEEFILNFELELKKKERISLIIEDTVITLLVCSTNLLNENLDHVGQYILHPEFVGLVKDILEAQKRNVRVIEVVLTLWNSYFSYLGSLVTVEDARFFIDEIFFYYCFGTENSLQFQFFQKINQKNLTNFQKKKHFSNGNMRLWP